MPNPPWVKENDFPKNHHQIADPEPDLRRIPNGKSLRGREICILTHQDLRATARVRSFIEFMVEAFARHRPLLEGHRPQGEDAGQ